MTGPPSPRPRLRPCPSPRGSPAAPRRATSCCCRAARRRSAWPPAGARLGRSCCGRPWGSPAGSPRSAPALAAGAPPRWTGRRCRGLLHLVRDAAAGAAPPGWTCPRCWRWSLAVGARGAAAVGAAGSTWTHRRGRGAGTASLVDLLGTPWPSPGRRPGPRPPAARSPTACPGCGPGWCSAPGALAVLDPAEVEAVLAHEQAHLRQRHDLVVLPFVALGATFPRLRGVLLAQEQVARAGGDARRRPGGPRAAGRRCSPPRCARVGTARAPRAARWRSPAGRGCRPGSTALAAPAGRVGPAGRWRARSAAGLLALLPVALMLLAAP